VMQLHENCQNTGNGSSHHFVEARMIGFDEFGFAGMPTLQQPDSIGASAHRRSGVRRLDLGSIRKCKTVVNKPSIAGSSPRNSLQ
jgi:hypothetical protein